MRAIDACLRLEALFLATLLIAPKKLSAKAMDRMVRSITFVRVAHWRNFYVVTLALHQSTLILTP
jgi:hypothetical protein